MYEGMCEQEVPILRPYTEAFVVFNAYARVYCENKSREIGHYHDPDMAFLISFH